MADDSSFYNPSTGIYSDFQRLLREFVALKSVRYESFAAVWKEQKLSMICAGRNSAKECTQFIEDCFWMAKQMFARSSSFQTKVCAVYILYAMYCTQPLTPTVKIRITPAQWQQISALLLELQEQKHLDVEYCVRILISDRAFWFVAEDFPLYPGSQVPHGEETLRKTASAAASEQSYLQNALSQETVDTLSLVHQRYMDLKAKLFSTKGAEGADTKEESGSRAARRSVTPGSSTAVTGAADRQTAGSAAVHVIDDSIIQQITKARTTYEEFMKSGGKRKTRRRRESGTSGSDSEGESESDAGSVGGMGASSAQDQQLTRRAMIRKRAYSQLPLQSRQRRHRKIQSSSQESDASVSPVRKSRAVSPPAASASPRPAPSNSGLTYEAGVLHADLTIGEPPSPPAPPAAGGGRKGRKKPFAKPVEEGGTGRRKKHKKVRRVPYLDPFESTDEERRSPARSNPKRSKPPRPPTPPAFARNAPSHPPGTARDVEASGSILPAGPRPKQAKTRDKTEILSDGSVSSEKKKKRTVSGSDAESVERKSAEATRSLDKMKTGGRKDMSKTQGVKSKGSKPVVSAKSAKSKTKMSKAGKVASSASKKVSPPVSRKSTSTKKVSKKSPETSGKPEKLGHIGGLASDLSPGKHDSVPRKRANKSKKNKTDRSSMAAEDGLPSRNFDTVDSEQVPIDFIKKAKALQSNIYL